MHLFRVDPLVKRLNKLNTKSKNKLSIVKENLYDLVHLQSYNNQYYDFHTFQTIPKLVICSEISLSKFATFASNPGLSQSLNSLIVSVLATARLIIYIFIRRFIPCPISPSSLQEATNAVLERPSVTFWSYNTNNDGKK